VSFTMLKCAVLTKWVVVVVVCHPFDSMVLLIFNLEVKLTQ